MPSTTIYERGQVVVVNVPLTGHVDSKPRPALVVSVDSFHRKLTGWKLLYTPVYTPVYTGVYGEGL